MIRLDSKIGDTSTLNNYLISDLKLVQIPTDFDIEFRGYSKRYYGRYYIDKKKIVVYILDSKGYLIPYHEILDTVLHEALHHYQHHHETGFVRVKGVMHNPTFKRLYAEKVDKLKKLEVLPNV